MPERPATTNSGERKSRKQSQIDKTRRWISEALMQLIEEMDYDQINVSLICKRAGVGRQTFYRHFHSKNDIVRYELDHISDELVVSLLKIEPQPVSDRDIHLLSARTWLRHAYLHPLVESPDLLPLFVDLVMKVRGTLEKQFDIPAPIESYKTSFRYGGITAVFIKWITSGAKESPEKLASILEECCRQ